MPILGVDVPSTSATIRFVSQEPRRHHYVPQWYLRRFASDGKVAVFDLQAGRLRLQSPRSVAFVDGLYDIDHAELPRRTTERLLSNIENLAARALRQAVTDGLVSLTDNQHEDLAMFLATQFIRVPGNRAHVEHVLRRDLDAIRAAMSDADLQEAAGHPLTGEELRLVRQPYPMELNLAGLTGGAVIIYGRALTEHLLADFDWFIHRLATAELVTSDRPVAPLSVTSGQIADVGAVITLDREHVLILRPKGQAPVHIDGDSTSALQLIAIEAADRYLVGDPRNPLWENLRAART